MKWFKRRKLAPPQAASPQASGSRLIGADVYASPRAADLRTADIERARSGAKLSAVGPGCTCTIDTRDRRVVDAESGCTAGHVVGQQLAGELPRRRPGENWLRDRAEDPQAHAWNCRCGDCLEEIIQHFKREAVSGKPPVVLPPTPDEGDAWVRTDDAIKSITDRIQRLAVAHAIDAERRLRR